MAITGISPSLSLATHLQYACGAPQFALWYLHISHRDLNDCYGGAEARFFQCVRVLAAMMMTASEPLTSLKQIDDLLHGSLGIVIDYIRIQLLISLNAAEIYSLATRGLFGKSARARKMLRTRAGGNAGAYWAHLVHDQCFDIASMLSQSQPKRKIDRSSFFHCIIPS